MTGVKRSSLQRELSGHLYYLYLSLVVKTAKLSITMNDYIFKESLESFLGTIVSMMAGEYMQLIGEGQSVINVI